MWNMFQNVLNKWSNYGYTKKTKEKNVTFNVIYYGKRMTLMGQIVFIYYFILLVLPRVYSLTLKRNVTIDVIFVNSG